MARFQPGDHPRVCCGAFWRHGIYFGDGWVNVTTVGKECEADAAKYQQTLDTLHRHATAPGEQPVVDGLAQGFSTLVTALTKYGEVLRGRNGANPLDASDLEPITASVPKATDELVSNIRSKCSALGGGAATAQQAPESP